MHVRSRILRIFACVVSANAAAQDPIHRRYTTDDGLASNTVYAILQDKEGFLWFATDAGVSRFDGHAFLNLSVGEGLTDNNVINLAQDSKGRIWFLTLNGRLCFWNGSAVVNEHALPELAPFQCGSGWQSFAEDKQGMLWFGGVRNDVLRLDLNGDHDTLWHLPTGIMSVLRDPWGEVYLSASGTLSRLHEGAWSVSDPGLPVGDMTPIISTPQGEGRRPLGIALEGIYSVEGQHWQKVIGTSFNSDVYDRCWSDRIGTLWIRLKRGGVEEWRQVGEGYVYFRTLFSDEVIDQVFVDTERDRWFATARHGLIMSTTQDFRTALFTGSQSALEQPMLVLSELPNGSVLVGSADNVLFRFDGRNLAPLPTPPLGRVLDIAQDDQDRIWLACDRTLVMLDPASGIALDVGIMNMLHGHETFTGLMPCKALEFMSDGRLWCANFGIQLLDRSARMPVRRMVPDSVVPIQRSLTLLADSKDRLWFETNAALHCLEGGHRRDFPHLDGRTGLRITSLAELAPDTLLIGTAGAGLLFVVDGEVIRDFTRANGAISNDVLRVRTMGDTLLIASNNGLQLMLNAKEFAGGERSPITTETMIAGQVNDALLLDDGLLLATSLGLCSVPFMTVDTTARPPALHLLGLWLNDSLVEEVALNDLIERRDRLRFSARAITFAHSGSVRYQFRLHDGDAWIESTDGNLDLPALSAGDYYIQLRARKQDSGWSLPISTGFTVRPSWWNRSWARIGLWLFLSASIILITRGFLRRRYVLAIAEVRQREALNEERRRIAADVHDDLGADLSRLLLHARKAELGAGGDPNVALGLSASIHKIDEIIWSLDPHKDTLLATVHFIEQQAREVVLAQGAQFRTLVALPGPDVELSANLRREVMLIAREAVRNVLEHAQATALRIDWSRHGAQVGLVIEDDGVGMPGHTGAERQGVKNMNERAARIGATLVFRSVQPHGTRVELRFAVPENHPIG